MEHGALILELLRRLEARANPVTKTRLVLDEQEASALKEAVSEALVSRKKVGRSWAFVPTEKGRRLLAESLSAACGAELSAEQIERLHGDLSRLEDRVESARSGLILKWANDMRLELGRIARDLDAFAARAGEVCSAVRGRSGLPDASPDGETDCALEAERRRTDLEALLRLLVDRREISGCHPLGIPLPELFEGCRALDPTISAGEFRDLVSLLDLRGVARLDLPADPALARDDPLAIETERGRCLYLRLSGVEGGEDRNSLTTERSLRKQGSL